VKELREQFGIEQTFKLLERAMESSLQGITISDLTQPDNPLIYANRGFERLTGYSREEILGRNCRFLQGAETSPVAIKEIRQAIQTKTTCSVELINYKKDKTPFWNALTIAPIFDQNSNCTHFVGIQTDVTPFKHLEEQLRHSQKMEAVGLLAGGVAHDFNNLLTVINGCSELLRADSQLSQESAELVEEIHHSGERASGLTRQLLAFSRRQMMQPRAVNIHDLLNQLSRILLRIIGEDVRLDLEFQADQPIIFFDPSQFEQVILNLVVNARDAMPQGGQLIIRTSNVTLDTDMSSFGMEVPAGDYVVVEVQDTGMGMDSKTRQRIFEPFFTTKGPGRGTGLGLATVYGIVRQSGSTISVFSQPSRGTTFSVAIPSVKEPKSGILTFSDSITEGGTESILLVEDEPGVRAFAQRVLEDRGYRVWIADGPKTALALAQSIRDPIHLVISDVVLPEMSGSEVVQRIKEMRKDIRELYISGYHDDAIIRHGVCNLTSPFLHKPFTVSDFLKKIREVLDAAAIAV
jgi:two-component system, cell cycle sensor histidine kinase and response regulator CckA